MIPNFVVSAQSVVRLAVTLRDDRGEALQTDITHLDVVMGHGQLLPKIEEAILGLSVGERQILQLEPGEAFGEHDESQIVEFDREEFPETVAPDDLYDAETNDGATKSLRVLEVHEDYVLVDLNHPLAGAALTMEIEVVAIRPANQGDVAAANIAREKSRSSSGEQLLPLNHLLKGHPRR